MMGDKVLELCSFFGDDDGTFGALMDAEGPFCVTLEREWMDNEANVSCIPAGIYALKKTIYHRYDTETYEVCGVPDRSRILIHTGNTEDDSAGCILVGEKFGEVGGKDGILSSKSAFKKFMQVMGGVEEATLIVRRV